MNSDSNPIASISRCCRHHPAYWGVPPAFTMTRMTSCSLTNSTATQRATSSSTPTHPHTPHTAILRRPHCRTPLSPGELPPSSNPSTAPQCHTAPRHAPSAGHPSQNHFQPNRKPNATANTLGTPYPMMWAHSRLKPSFTSPRSKALRSGGSVRISCSGCVQGAFRVASLSRWI